MPKGTGIVVVCTLVAQAIIGCGSYSSAPTAPAQVQPPTQVVPPVPPPAASPGFSYAPGYVLTAVSLSGVVTERTAAEQTPLEDVRVYCDACGATGHTWQFTDKNGRYNFPGDLASGGGVWLTTANPTPLSLQKEGFVGLPSISVTMNGDTEFDVEMQRR